MCNVTIKMNFESYNRCLTDKQKGSPMHMISQNSPVETQSPEALLHLVHSTALKYEAPKALPGWWEGWLRASNRVEAPWLEIIPRAEPGIPAEAHSLFVAQRATILRVQYWETVVFYTLGISGAAAVAIAFWVLGHIAQ